MDRKITALKLQKRNPNRVNVFLDGSFAFGIAKVLAVGLKINQVLSPEKIEELQDRDNYEVALQKALNYISYRTRSTAEVQKKLFDLDMPQPVIEKVINRLQETDLLNDNRFAIAWVANRNDLRPRGKYLLRQELRKKGISETIIEQALDMQEETNLAYQAAYRKATKLINLDKYDFKRKLFGFLGRRGFDYDTISQVVDQLWMELRGAEEDWTPPTDL